MNTSWTYEYENFQKIKKNITELLESNCNKSLTGSFPSVFTKNNIQTVRFEAIQHWFLDSNLTCTIGYIFDFFFSVQVCKQ